MSVTPERLEYIRKWSESDSEPLHCHAMRELLEVIDWQRGMIEQLKSDRESLIESIKDMAVRHDCEVQAQRDELMWLRKEIDNTIGILIPADCRVRVCEGGGEEDVCKSLSVSVAKPALKAGG